MYDRYNESNKWNFLSQSLRVAVLAAPGFVNTRTQNPAFWTTWYQAVIIHFHVAYISEPDFDQKPSS